MATKTKTNNNLATTEILATLATLTPEQRAALISALLSKTVATTKPTTTTKPTATTKPTTTKPATKPAPTKPTSTKTTATKPATKPYSTSELTVTKYGKSYVISGYHRDMRPLLDIISFTYANHWGEDQLTGYAITQRNYNRYHIDRIIDELRTTDDWRRIIKNKASYIKGRMTRRANYIAAKKTTTTEVLAA